MFARYVYFLVIGWWFGLLAAGFGLFLCATIIFLPFGVLVLNRLPTFVFMREEAEENLGIQPPDVPFVLRVLWFFFLGWTLGSLLIGLGYLASITIIGIPLGIYLLNRVPMVMTLSRVYD